MKTTLLFVALLVASVYGDIYLHNMRGSNNRLNENNDNRNNANRLFDSQNNNRGGYNVGDEAAAQDGQGIMQYYATSELTLEWTNQHGAGNPNVNNDLVMQYMCDDNTPPYNNAGIRDGTNTNRVDNDQADRGRHETAQYYADCQARDRNQGLFLADQDLDGDNAQFTRQNTNGDEYGYECPEERDYYPYWHPTPWKDIAIYTNRPEIKCPLYASDSQNVATKNYCSDAQYNNANDCNNNGATWNAAAAHGIAAPACLESPWSRDNHLGNTVGGQTIAYNWTIPTEAANNRCVFRIRYNITTNDYDTENTFADMNGEDESPIADNPTFNFGEEGRVISVKLALNTDQYGRTFEDRSHTFDVLAAPGGVSGKIYNLNVRGRRGNIVQTYPAVEYDFVPSHLEMKANDVVHIQWTGSQNTPDGAGQGQGSTDRSNIVQVANAQKSIPLTFAEATMFPAQLEEDLATVGTGAGVNNQLDGTNSYYNAGLVTLNTGTWHYLCTRNNNFTNRSQKGVINVTA